MEKIKNIIEILQAFNEGKPIQWKDNYSNWYDFVGNEDNLLEVLYKFEWRIKPELTYRPYKNVTEFFEAQKEHGFYINIDNILYKCPISVSDMSILINWNTEKGNTRVISYSELLKKSTWQDGTPCGIKE